MTQPSALGGGERVDVSVLVPVLNESRDVRRAVAAMQTQELDGTIEFLFIDGGSEDDTRRILDELARDDPRIRLLDNPARRTPQALNIGLRAARGSHIARMDAHTVYSSTYLAAGVERLRHRDVDWVSGAQLAHGTTPWSRRVEMALGSWLGVGGARFRRPVETEFEVDTGFTGMWRTETLEAYGGWDEGWPVNQDTELAARIRANGGRLLCVPGMEGLYIPRGSARALARQYWVYGQYRAKTAQRHPHSMRRSQLLAPGLAGTLVAAVAAPRPLRRLARAALGVYAACVVVTSAAASKPGRRRDAILLPAVFGVIHLSWGFGFLVGSVRFGPPARAVARVLTPRRRP